METWENLDYSSTDTRKWVELMNISTVEFGVAPFPPNLIVVTGWLADAVDAGNVTLVNDTIVIEHAGREHIGQRAIAPVVLGVAAAVAGIWACWWLCTTWIHAEFLRPRGGNEGSNATVPDSRGHSDFVSADVFRARVAEYYPRGGGTKHEAREKDWEKEDLGGEDVEEVIELLRRMFEIDLYAWARENDNDVTKDELVALRGRSDAILREVHTVVGEWKGLGALRPWLDPEEKQVVEGIFEVLAKIGMDRHRR